jgi:hypothetical protein
MGTKVEAGEKRHNIYITILSEYPGGGITKGLGSVDRVTIFLCYHPVVMGDYQETADCQAGILMVIMGCLMVYLLQLIFSIISPYHLSHRGKLMELFQTSFFFICSAEGTPENGIS